MGLAKQLVHRAAEHCALEASCSARGHRDEAHWVGSALLENAALDIGMGKGCCRHRYGSFTEPICKTGQVRVSLPLLRERGALIGQCDRDGDTSEEELGHDDVKQCA